MAERQQKKKQAPERTEDVVADASVDTEQGEKIKGELDDLLDEIDEVLESNAEDFVKSYVQKGGE
jgi:ubiquitin-like protein Pup